MPETETTGDGPSPDRMHVPSVAAAPLVSIGMPVYNEARFIASALGSLTAQTFPNIEIVISDNASTDDTEKLCRQAMASDARIRYHRFSENRGVTENFRKVLEESRGDYFMWAAGHDLWSDNLIAHCVGLLEQCPDATIAFGSSQWIDGDGEALSKQSGWCDTRGMDPVARFFSVFWGNMHPILGVMRMQVVREIKTIHSCVGSDLIMLLEMVLKGHFVHAAQTVWYRREFRAPESHRDRIDRYRRADYGLAKAPLDRYFPLLRLPLEVSRVVWRADLTWLEKIAIYVALFPSLPARYIAGRK